ncbi:MAG: double-strand break repair protein AddB, partial [Parvularculaceae bacterium]|nr:double-strand break repair protein AddB [Parvularculaceae bacterium]
DDVGGLLDSLYAEEIDFARLRAIAPADCAAHWESSLDFLKVVTEAWPAYLAAQNLEDPARRRARLLDAAGKRLARETGPVVVAGTTGSMPAVARLMAIAARLPQGAVILPGLDRALAADTRGWSMIDDGHPQAGISAALAAIGVTPDEVAPWPSSADAASPRGALISLALRPAAATDDWLALAAAAGAEDKGFARALDGVLFIDAAHEEAEAAAIALLLREALETPGRTAMLVTPDRDLGRRVAAKMRRWGVIVEDSGGTPLAGAAIGGFLRLVAEWLAAPADPLAVMALARSRFARFGLDNPGPLVGRLDRRLRGPQLTEDLAVLAAWLEGEDAGLAPLLAAFKDAAAHWPAGGRDETERVEIAALLDAHLAASERIAAGSGGAATDLWRGEDGDAASKLLSELTMLAPALGTIAPADYPQTFVQLISAATLRGADDAHPRLAILGPLEARLLSADLVILGGLNEGVWPSQPGLDAFLSRQMRKEAGLPSVERRIGLSAHDFAQLAAAPRVVFSRARVSAGTPARPSRWIVRLKNILQGANALGPFDATARLAAIAAAADRPAAVEPTPPPRPMPPVEARPRELPVTDVETLIRDPYSIYAKRILRLKPLDRLGEPIDRRHFGNLLHKAFELFTRDGVDPGAPDAFARLKVLLAKEARRRGIDGAFLAAWRSRFDDAMAWFLGFDRQLRDAGARSFPEAQGAHAFDIGGREFRLTAKADRIAVADGGARIFDYKSGSLPTLDQMTAGFSPQLPLIALIVEAGGFVDLGPRTVESFAYLKAFNRKEDGKDDVAASGDDARAIIARTEAAFRRLIAAFDDPRTPYLSQPRPQFLTDYGQYDRLARRREWGVEEGAE